MVCESERDWNARSLALREQAGNCQDTHVVQPGTGGDNGVRHTTSPTSSTVCVFLKALCPEVPLRHPCIKMQPDRLTRDDFHDRRSPELPAARELFANSESPAHVY